MDMATTDTRFSRRELAERLSRVVPADRLARDVPMREHTSFRIGGPADFMVTVNNMDELIRVGRSCRELGAAFLVLGRGTNLLVRDGGIRGVVIKLAGDFLEIRYSGEKVTAGAAVGLADLARQCGERGLAGLEFAIGIPGTVGGAVIMNAGAYGREMKDVVEAGVFILPEALDGAKAEPAGISDPAVPIAVPVPAGELGFGYRTSRPQREGWIVVSATLRLDRGDPGRIRRLEEEYTTRRRSRQPLDLPSAGSFFKRPRGHYAGELIERAGLRGARIGDAQVSEKHVGFIVNLGAATARDVLELIDHVRRAVLRNSGVLLEPEIRIVGEDGG